MAAKRLLEKYYTVEVTPFYDDMSDGMRQELSIVCYVVYKTDRSNREDHNLHLIWYSSADIEEYGIWGFDHMTVIAFHLEILMETNLISEIAKIDVGGSRTQPQEFEMRLRALGFRRK